MEQNTNIIECNYDPCIQCCKPYDKKEDLFKDIEVNAIIDGSTTEKVRVDKGENSLTFIFSGLKGQQGDPGDSGSMGLRGDTGPQGPVGKTPTVTADATVINNTGDAQCRVTTTGTKEAPVFHFTFSGLKGLNGSDGADGKDGKDGKDGADGSSSSYDDTQIMNLINQNSENITSLINNMGNNVKSGIETLLNDTNWVLLHAQGIKFGEEESEDVTEDYLNRMGFWEQYEDPETHDITTITKFSKIEQDVDSIGLRVGQLETNQQVGGEVDYQVLSANMSAYLDENGATAGFDTYWGKLIKADNQQGKELLEWMGSTAESFSTAGKTFYNILSAAENVTTLQSAYAGLLTIVEDINDNYVSRASLSTSVRDEVNDKISEAGFITESTLEESLSGIFAQNSVDGKEITAKIFALANADGSGITIDADNINLKGQTWADIIGLTSPESEFDNTYHTVIGSSTITITGTGNKQGSNTIVGAGGIDFTASSTPGTLEGSVGATGFTFPGLTYYGTYGDHGNLVCSDSIQAGGFETPAVQGSPMIPGATMVVPYTENGTQKYMIFRNGLFIGVSTNKNSANMYLSTGSADGNIITS